MCYTVDCMSVVECNKGTPEMPDFVSVSLCVTFSLPAVQGHIVSFAISQLFLEFRNVVNLECFFLKCHWDCSIFIY